MDEVESEETYEGVDYADVPHDEQASDSSNAGGDEASEASLDQEPGEEPGACDNVGDFHRIASYTKYHPLNQW